MEGGQIHKNNKINNNWSFNGQKSLKMDATMVTAEIL